MAMLGEFEQAAALAAGAKQVRTTSGIVRKFLWIERVVRARGITTATVEHYLACLVVRGRSPKTLYNHRSALSAFCGFLVRRGLLSANPCRDVRLAPLEEQLPRYLNDDEIEQVLRIANAAGIWPEVCLALSTGLRLSEMIRLTWADVDVERRSLTVRRSKSRRPRTVPLARSALAALAAQREVAGEFSHVFPARQTWPGGWRYVDRPRASNWWRRALPPIQDAVPKFRDGLPATATGRGWHLFRHTFASRAVQGGPGRPAVSIFKLSAWLGHSDVRTTRIYAHLQAGYDEEIETVSIVREKGDV